MLDKTIFTPENKKDCDRLCRQMKCAECCYNYAIDCPNFYENEVSE